MNTEVDLHRAVAESLVGLTFPIAETFVSPQGEGEHAGRLMLFIRLAGCTVGRKFKLEEITSEMGPLHIYQEKCTLYDGRVFACDTDFQKKSLMTLQQIIQLAEEKHMYHICLTGGEPLMHKNVHSLINALDKAGFKVHIETSGTIPLTPELESALKSAFVAVAPKAGFLDEYLEKIGITNEIKLLVDRDFAWHKVPLSVRKNPRKIFLQPVNFEFAVDRGNLQLCLQLQLKNPLVRISIQLHKILGVR